jgi:hypothetical protein
MIVKHVHMLTFLAILVLIVGCDGGKPKFEDHSQDPERYANSVKELALNATYKAARSREPGDMLLPLVTELQDQDTNRKPVGNYKPVYTELLTKTKSLVEDCDKANGGRPSSLSGKLNEIEAVAKKLPGEVQIDKGSGND